MKLEIMPIKHSITLIAAMALIILFIYSGTTKFLAFDKFTQEMSLSPFFNKSLVPYTAFTVLTVELIIAGLFLLDKTRDFAFLMSITLLTVFTTYIHLLLNSEFMPCSCGGILNQMDWGTHIIFNVAFILLATLGYIFNYDKKK